MNTCPEYRVSRSDLHCLMLPLRITSPGFPFTNKSDLFLTRPSSILLLSVTSPRKLQLTINTGLKLEFHLLGTQTTTPIYGLYESRQSSAAIVEMSSQPASTTAKGDSENPPSIPQPDINPSNTTEKTTCSDNDASTSTTKTTTGITAWGSTTGKPYLSSPRLDDPKSSSVVTSFFSSMASGKGPASGSGLG